MPIKHRILIEQLLMASAREGMKSILWTESHIFQLSLEHMKICLNFRKAPHYIMHSVPG